MDGESEPVASDIHHHTKTFRKSYIQNMSPQTPYPDTEQAIESQNHSTIKKETKIEEERIK